MRPSQSSGRKTDVCVEGVQAACSLLAARLACWAEQAEFAGSIGRRRAGWELLLAWLAGCVLACLLSSRRLALAGWPGRESQGQERPGKARKHR